MGPAVPLIRVLPLLALVACTYEPGPLVDPTLWVEATAGEDPFDDRPAEVDCNPGGYAVELDTIFEVETDACPYGTFTQPLLRDVGPGATVELLGWHLDLFADPPGEAHYVVRIGGIVLFEARPEVPSEEEIWDLAIDWPGEERVAAGEPAFFHVHNHGTNSWRLGAVEIVD